MMRIAIIEQDRTISLEDLTSPESLRSAIELARKWIAECESRLRSTTAGQVTKRPAVPYL
jgi:hypothetical protein